MKVDYSIKDVLISLFVGIACATLIGCAENCNEREIKDPRDLWCQEEMEYINFDGHEYVLYRDGTRHSQWATAGIAHSPKCPCVKKEMEVQFH